jgi:hypothetical protein
MSRYMGVIVYLLYIHGKYSEEKLTWPVMYAVFMLS